MTDLNQILPLWSELRQTRVEYVLATVVAVEGSSYRKPGARMVVAADGRHAGIVSGGCLESEVARKAFWNTENGPVVMRYSTSADDGDLPFGMGCGGAVHLLLERSGSANSLMDRLARNFRERKPMAIATVLDGEAVGRRGFWQDETDEAARNLEYIPENDPVALTLTTTARRAYEERRSFSDTVHAGDGGHQSIRAEWVAPRAGLFIFGAGNDAIPLVRQAAQLGWYVSVADGRAHLATRARFPEADDVIVLSAGGFISPPVKSTDAAVMMTHSFEQDARVLGGLLSEDLAYIGVLGPRRRTRELVSSIAKDLNLHEPQIEEQAEAWLERLHAPMGLDLGGDTPAEIALAVIAEIQKSLHRATGKSLRQVRASGAEQSVVSASLL